MGEDIGCREVLQWNSQRPGTRKLNKKVGTGNNVVLLLGSLENLIAPTNTVTFCPANQDKDARSPKEEERPTLGSFFFYYVVKDDGQRHFINEGH